VKQYQVYWIHLPDHTDITSEGYVGITSTTLEKRMRKHLALSSNPVKCKYILHKALNKYSDKYVSEVICICDKEYAKWLEFKLRPTDFIGWNMRSGGMTGPTLTEDQKLLKKEKWYASMEGNFPSGSNHWNWKGGIRSDPNYNRKTSDNEELKRIRREVAIKNFKDVPLTEEHKKKLSEIKIKHFEENGPWSNNLANHQVWKMAQEVYESWLGCPCGDRAMCNRLSLARTKSILNMIKMFREGWIPVQDERFMRFKNAES
jgi:hypothetical protein